MPVLKVDCVVGARPNFMKVAPILRELRRRSGFSATLIHTGQHFSPEMSDVFFDELGIGKPDVNLGIGMGSAIWQTAEMMKSLETQFEMETPDLVLVVGDVNSTLAAALVAAKMSIPLAHVEAGLRSGDRTMPEEINRIVTDSIADLLFASEPSGVQNLLREGVPSGKVHLAGNVMIDTLLHSLAQAKNSGVLERFGLHARRYALVTLHRPSNVDNGERLSSLVAVLRELAHEIPIVFSVHPRTRQRIASAGLLTDPIVLAPPLGYMDFLHLTSEARLVLTDSGGIQEETTVLRVPCLTVRENTERPITILQGSNRLVGVDPVNILAEARSALKGEERPIRGPELWDGKAARRIVDVLEKLPARTPLSLAVAVGTR